MRESPFRSLIGAGLLLVSLVVFHRAGYGPGADRRWRQRPCVDATRCPHNALLLAAIGAGLLARSNPVTRLTSTASSTREGVRHDQPQRHQPYSSVAV
jgi:hypothetical protein